MGHSNPMHQNGAAGGGGGAGGAGGGMGSVEQEGEVGSEGPNSNDIRGDWQRCVSAENSKTYYWNTDTNVTSWDVPDIWLGSDAAPTEMPE